MGGKCTKDSKNKAKTGTSKDKEITKEDKKNQSQKESLVNLVKTSIVEVQPKVCNVLILEKKRKIG